MCVIEEPRGDAGASPSGSTRLVQTSPCSRGDVAREHIVQIYRTNHTPCARNVYCIDLISRDLSQHHDLNAIYTIIVRFSLLPLLNTPPDSSISGRPHPTPLFHVYTCPWRLGQCFATQPVMDGPKATEMIRQSNGPNAKTPIVFVTATASEEASLTTAT